ncbi:hypothetical protein [Streptomyces sp. NBC_00140]|uniref:hypothetical protein n=1 Tax=Streptomyces sp. NBC_00140 TaxID=2975664 RepID=UPI00224D015A|nr:hypothetical protein [Streptomyces sp. NBC_00140]MCX5338114.1 hypothetical protein [Streptomyces sp. NBC_00140]
MKWLLMGALLALLLIFPPLLAGTATVVAWLLAKPVLVAFGLGLVVRGYLPRMRRWAR